MGKIVLCADSESLVRPWMIGLEGVDLESLNWIVPFSSGESARVYLRMNADIEAVWIASSDDIAPVNLAAAIRKDNNAIPVLLVAGDVSGSTMSCANAAGVSRVVSPQELSDRFGIERNRRARMNEVAQIGSSTKSSASATIVSGSPRYRADQTVPYPVSIDDGTLPIEEPSELRIYPQSSALSCKPEKTGLKESGINRSSDAFVMSVVSGSGGAGKSAICAVAAGLSVARGFNTLLLDCDLQFGDMKYLFGMTNAPTIDDALSDPTYLERLSEESRKQRVPALITAPARLESSEILAGYIANLIDACARYFDAVILNTGSSWSDLHAELLERSSCTLFVIDQRASSVHACRHAIELCLRMGIATGSFLYAINRCSRTAMFGATEISSILKSANIFEIKDGGQEIEEILGAGLALELASSKSDFTKSIDFILSEAMDPFKEAKSFPARASGNRVADLGGRTDSFTPAGAQMIGSNFSPYEVNEPAIVEGKRSTHFRIGRFSSKKNQPRRRKAPSKQALKFGGDDFGRGSIMRMEIR